MTRYLALLPLLLTVCATQAPAQTTAAGRLHADLTVLDAFPQAQPSAACTAKVGDLITVIHQITALKQAGKPVDPVSQDVLASSQRQAATACHPDAVRLCHASATSAFTPAQTKACADAAN